MALQKREKKLIKVLVVVALVSGFVLLKDKIFPGDPEDIQEQIVGEFTETMEERDEEIARRTGGGGGGGGGGSRTGGGSGGSSEPAITTAEFQRHNNLTDCWVLINGNVYDITLFAEASNDDVSQFCGTFGFEAGFLAENSKLESVVLKNAKKQGVIK